jgi:hypothetical protein
MLTTQVEIDRHSIVRSWLFGRTTAPVGDITRLDWGGGRGQLMLSIRYGKKHWIQLSNIVLTTDELHEIQSDILAFRGLEGIPLWPPMAPYVDVERMVESNKRSE